MLPGKGITVAIDKPNNFFGRLQTQAGLPNLQGERTVFTKQVLEFSCCLPLVSNLARLEHVFEAQQADVCRQTFLDTLGA